METAKSVGISEKYAANYVSDAVGTEEVILRLAGPNENVLTGWEVPWVLSCRTHGFFCNKKANLQGKTKKIGVLYWN